MKLSCTQENLNKGINLIGKIIGLRATLPILNNLLLATDNGRLKISATDLEIGINAWVGAKVVEEGSITVPARLIQEFVNTNNDKTIDLVLDNTTLNLKSERYKANIKGINAAEFPLIPNIKKKVFVQIDSAVLQEAITQTVLACAMDETRPVLTGVLFKFQQDELKVVATDSYRLAEKKIKLEQKVDKDTQIIVPQRAILELNRILQTQEAKVDIYLDENQILFVTGDVEFVTRLIEGTFPDYEQIIPQKTPTEATIAKQDFSNAIKMASFFARESANNIKLAFEKSKLQIIATSPQVGDNVSRVDSQTTGPLVEIAFNAKFILDFLGAIVAEKVVVATNDKTSPAIFKSAGDKSYLYIIMPLRTEE